MQRFIAIGLVWLGCGLAWMILGSALMLRSEETTGRLGSDVQSLWGPPIVQQPPEATYVEAKAAPRAPTPGSTDVKPASTKPAPPAQPPKVRDVPLVGSKIQVGLRLRQRKKGLVWFATYAVDFDALYSFRNSSDTRHTVDFHFPLERSHALYDGFKVLGPSGKPIATTVADGTASWQAELAPGETRRFRVKYRSRGTDRWRYTLTTGTSQVKNFELSLTTNFDAVDFPADTLSPSSFQERSGGWSGKWRFKSLVASSPIGIDMPERLNPGPLAARITFFAPVGLLFFFFVVAILAGARAHALHPMHYFFLGCGFFAFHLLFAYLVDHLSVVPSFALSALVSTALVTTYARLFVGWKFALREIGVSQLIYLVLFSVSFFWAGFTGLSITVGAIITLFVMMQMTGRHNWGESKADDARRGCVSP